MKIIRDPAGDVLPTDRCFCGETALYHPTDRGCDEFDPPRRAINMVANMLTDLIEMLEKVTGKRPS